ncbi:putative Calcineurin subunit B [Blattamonas nauphoetae]|uniref:Calcineurin subunit B n=1 Tax=Blattamonas nauphoetae TaxID=2049346 RepID=A0ABQ9XJT4_9EUKA|nr:putative Calcineurin subunit B [Blattamonas nauphoetae]
MGGSTSHLSDEDYEELGKQFRFSPEQITELYQRFRRLDMTRRGSLSVQDLMKLPELAMNPMHPRILELFEKNKDERIDFASFLTPLDIMSNGTPRERAEFAFKLYDMNNDGVITTDDLEATLDKMTGDNLTEDKREATIKHVMQVTDLDHDGIISLEDFCTAMKDSDMVQKPVHFTFPSELKPR